MCTNFVMNTAEHKEGVGVRIEWDEYFMSIAVLAACRSPCKRLHVGSVVVKDKRIVAMGYNGFLPGCKHESHIRDGHEQATIHSEMNSITDCAKRGISMDKSSIYITHYPCLNCFKALCASGVTEIVYLDDYNNDPLVAKIAGEVGVKIRQGFCTKSAESANTVKNIGHMTNEYELDEYNL